MGVGMGCESVSIGCRDSKGGGANTKESSTTFDRPYRPPPRMGKVHTNEATHTHLSVAVGEEGGAHEAVDLAVARGAVHDVGLGGLPREGNGGGHLREQVDTVVLRVGWWS